MKLKNALTNSRFNNPDELINDPNVAFIGVSKNKCCIVDIWNYLWLTSLGTWRLDSRGYAFTQIDNKNIWMHRLIAKKMNLNLTNDIDHINNNSIDNRGHNLRSATRSQNASNSKIRINNKIGLKNIYYNKTKNKWQVQITKNYKKIYIGVYVNLKEAIEARDKAVIKYHGDFARLK